MKALKLFGIAIIGIMLLYTCEKQDDEITSANDVFQKSNLESKYGQADGTLELPFKAHFYTKRNYSKEEEGATYCTEDPYTAFNYQVGEGEATHLGHFTTEMHFCGAGFDYINAEGVFVAANGDELYFKFEEGTIGHVILYTEEDVVPPYEAHFEDPFIFNGGTGRFENASGGGKMNSKVDLFDDEGNFIAEHQTDHIWTGTLILPKGKD